MKKMLILISVVVLVIPMFICTKINASSKTLRQLLEELDILEKNLSSVGSEKDLTEEKLKEVTDKIVSIGLRINEIENNIIEMQKELDEINVNIDKKKSDIKSLLRAMQKSNSNNLYLEILFGSKPKKELKEIFDVTKEHLRRYLNKNYESDNLTNFIYELKTVEQILAYNDKTIKELNKIIEDNKAKEIELKEERRLLDEENDKLIIEQQELGSKLNVLDEDARDILEDIAAARTVIKNYQKNGCNLDDTLESCSRIPEDSTFKRPLNSGVITSGYGVRDNPVSGGYQFHAAIDIGGNPTGTSVYAAADGIVVLAYHTPNPSISNSSCGGNFVVIQHQINGKYYATRYMHLSKIYVTDNQRVTSNDIIGAVGGGELYDRCSTGAHLDFSIASGIYGKDFYMFRQPATINPYTLINFPKQGYFTDRNIKY